MFIYMYLQGDCTFTMYMFNDTTFTNEVHESHVQSIVVDSSTS